MLWVGGQGLLDDESEKLRARKWNAGGRGKVWLIDIMLASLIFVPALIISGSCVGQ